MCWWYGHIDILCWSYVDLNNAPIFGVPRDRGVLIVQPTRLSLHNTLLRWDICWKWLEDLCVGDDQSVLSNMMYPGSTCLKKKCAAATVACHFVREGVTREEAIDNGSIFMKCWLSAWEVDDIGSEEECFCREDPTIYFRWSKEWLGITRQCQNRTLRWRYGWPASDASWSSIS